MSITYIRTLEKAILNLLKNLDFCIGYYHVPAKHGWEHCAIDPRCPDDRCIYTNEHGVKIVTIDGDWYIDNDEVTAEFLFGALSFIVMGGDMVESFETAVINTKTATPW